MKKSGLLELNYKDWLKGLFVSIVSAVLTAVMQMLTLVPPMIDFKQIGIVALTTVIAYIVKQLATNNNGDLFKKDEVEDIGGGGIKNPKP